MAALGRSADREKMVPFRMSDARKRDLARRAEERGLTVQQFLERSVWGDPVSPLPDQMEMPLTG